MHLGRIQRPEKSHGLAAAVQFEIADGLVIPVKDSRKITDAGTIKRRARKIQLAVQPDMRILIRGARPECIEIIHGLDQVRICGRTGTI